MMHKLHRSFHAILHGRRYFIFLLNLHKWQPHSIVFASSGHILNYSIQDCATICMQLNLFVWHTPGTCPHSTRWIVPSQSFTCDYYLDKLKRVHKTMHYTYLWTIRHKHAIAKVKWNSRMGWHFISISRKSCVRLRIIIGLLLDSLKMPIAYNHTSLDLI